MLAMIILIISYIYTGNMIFVWLTIMAGFTNIVGLWVWYKRCEKEHVDDLVQRCIEDLKNGGDY